MVPTLPLSLFFELKQYRGEKKLKSRIFKFQWKYNNQENIGNKRVLDNRVQSLKEIERFYKINIK